VSQHLADYSKRTRDSAPPTEPSNRLVYRALLGSCGICSVFTPQFGQRSRYSSTITILMYSKHGRSRTVRSITS
jgi:hypothetical protein